MTQPITPTPSSAQFYYDDQCDLLNQSTYSIPYSSILLNDIDELITDCEDTADDIITLTTPTNHHHHNNNTDKLVMKCKPMVPLFNVASIHNSTRTNSYKNNSLHKRTLTSIPQSCTQSPNGTLVLPLPINTTVQLRKNSVILLPPPPNTPQSTIKSSNEIIHRSVLGELCGNIQPMPELNNIHRKMSCY